MTREQTFMAPILKKMSTSMDAEAIGKVVSIFRYL